MKSIRWIMAAIAVFALAGQAMSQMNSGDQSGAAQQGSSVDQSDPNNPNNPSANPNTGTSNTGNVDQGITPNNNTNTNNGAVTGNEAPNSTNPGVTTTKNCHWWSMSKECRDQRQNQNKAGTTTTPSNP